jgi:hypothetical protein
LVQPLPGPSADACPRPTMSLMDIQLPPGQG